MASVPRRADASRETTMRLTLALLGWTLDWSLEPTTTTTEDDAEDTGYTDAGTTGHYPVTFTAAHDMPDEASLVDHNNGWGDEGNRLGFR